MAQAQAECYAMWHEATIAFHERHSEYTAAMRETELRRGMNLDPLDRGTSLLRDRFGTALKMLVGSVGLLLLMVCANVAGLLIARGAARREEIALRLAMGATRGRLIRQMLTESCVLAALGAAGGLLLAVIATPLLVRALPPDSRFTMTARLALSLDLSPDRRVLVFSIAISAITVVLFGMVPAIAARSRTTLDSVLPRGALGPRMARGPRQALIVCSNPRCARCCWRGAGLLVRTFEQLREVNPGFDSGHVVTFSDDPSLNSYTPAQAKAIRLAFDRPWISRMPGVRRREASGQPSADAGERV